MNDEAESSAAGLRRDGSSTSDPGRDHEDEAIEGFEELEEDAAELEKRAKERRLDAKRKRVVFLDHLLRELDALVFVELIAIYYLEYVYTQRPPLDGPRAVKLHGRILTVAFTAVLSSGSLSGPSSTSPCSLPSPTCSSLDKMTNTSHFSLSSCCPSLPTSSFTQYARRPRPAKTLVGICMAV